MDFDIRFIVVFNRFSFKTQLKNDIYFPIFYLQEKTKNGSTSVFVSLPQMDKLEIEFRYPFLTFVVVVVVFVLVSIQDGILTHNPFPLSVCLEQTN